MSEGADIGILIVEVDLPYQEQNDRCGAFTCAPTKPCKNKILDKPSPEGEGGLP